MEKQVPLDDFLPDGNDWEPVIDAIYQTALYGLAMAILTTSDDATLGELRPIIMKMINEIAEQHQTINDLRNELKSYQSQN